jgi:uncharacterized membrane-anchored protein YitT (DUF2179 family)
MRQMLKEYIWVFAGGSVYSIAFKYFVLPAKVVLTGTEGIEGVSKRYYITPIG